MLLARIFLPFALGYYFSYLYRAINAVIFRDLAQDVGLTATGLGLVTSAYFVMFALAQLPLGLALDRFGPRKVDATLLLVAAIGAGAFSYAQSIEQLVLARALIGVGVSAALMASMKAFTLWFPRERLAGLNGWLFAIGGLGAITASAPVEAAVALIGWRAVFQWVAFGTILVAAAVMFMVPDRESAASGETFGSLLRGTREVLTSSRFWQIAGVVTLSLGASLALQTLWIGPWLRDHLGLDRQAIAQALLLLNIAMTIGFLGFGVAAAPLATRGVRPVTLLAVSVGLSIAILAILASGVTTGAIYLWTFYGFLVPGATLGFAILNPRFPVEAAGRVNTSLNMGTFVVAFTLQYGIGPVLARWTPIDGRYPPQAYSSVLAFIVVLQCAALAYLWWGERRMGPLSSAT
jgi:predicted MFS family arabinose efflux permease